MTLGDAIERALPFLRSEAESLMTLALRPYAPNGGITVVNEQEVPDYDVKPSVPGKIKGESSQTSDPVSRTATIGDVEVPVIEAGLHIPISAQAPTGGARGVGWEYVVTSVGPTDDPSLLGRRYLVVNSPAMSHATARRLDVVEVPGADS